MFSARGVLQTGDRPGRLHRRCKLNSKLGSHSKPQQAIASHAATATAQVGKTAILHELRARGEQVLDLEARSNLEVESAASAFVLKLGRRL